MAPELPKSVFNKHLIFELGELILQVVGKRGQQSHGVEGRYGKTATPPSGYHSGIRFLIWPGPARTQVGRMHASERARQDAG